MEALSLDGKIAHTGELMELFEGYARTHPQHWEYYQSIKEHLMVLLAIYQSQKEMAECPPTLN